MADGSETITVRAQKTDPKNPNPTTEISTVAIQRGQVQAVAARLYGQGYSRKQIAVILLPHLITDTLKARPKEQQLASARTRLRRWEQTQKFRDLVYEQALIELDLKSGVAMKGLAKKAAKGRVDAVRLMFELTGRHNPKGDAPPAQIILAIDGVPRPQRSATQAVEAITLNPDEAVVSEEDDEAA
jgi:hypothetical protein